MRNFIITVDNRINDIQMDINRVFGIDSLHDALLRLRLYCRHAAAELCHAFATSKRGITATGGWLTVANRVAVTMRMASVASPAWQPIPVPSPRSSR